MSQIDIQRASELILGLLQKMDDFKKATYSAVHDDIGSTLSAASLHLKLLTDSVESEECRKKALQIHENIKTCLGSVAELNRKLKSNWAPGSKQTFPNDLTTELQKLAAPFSVQVKTNIGNDPISFSHMMALHEGCSIFIRLAISRLAKVVEVSSKDSTWILEDDGILPLQKSLFDEFSKKLNKQMQIEVANNQLVIRLGADS